MRDHEILNADLVDKDFLNIWQEIQRTLIFDDSWVMSCQWLHVSQPYPNMSAHSFGDISCAYSFRSTLSPSPKLK